eukprot:12719982-Ditylum_brightwellii.AAC.1
MKELVEYLEGVKHLEIKNPPEKNSWNNNKTKKGKHKCDKDKKSQDVSDNNASSKKSSKHCKLCRMFGGNTKMHTTDRCNKKNLLSGLLDGHNKKQSNRAKKEEFCAMAKAFKKATVKSKKAC